MSLRAEDRHTGMFDLGPATTRLARVVIDVRDEQLDALTPCRDMRVRDLLDHIDGLAQAFTAAASKTPPEAAGGPQVDGSRIGADWRDRIPRRLDALAAAWRDQTAWEGTTQAGGLDMPGDAAARVALDEVIVHGWDLATATGQDYDAPADLVDAAVQFVQSFVTQHPEGIPGLFGPALKVPADASALEQLLGMTGRDPSRRPTDA